MSYEVSWSFILSVFCHLFLVSIVFFMIACYLCICSIIASLQGWQSPYWRSHYPCNLSSIFIKLFHFLYLPIAILVHVIAKLMIYLFTDVFCSVMWLNSTEKTEENASINESPFFNSFYVIGSVKWCLYGAVAYSLYFIYINLVKLSQYFKSLVILLLTLLIKGCLLVWNYSLIPMYNHMLVPLLNFLWKHLGLYVMFIWYFFVEYVFKPFYLFIVHHVRRLNQMGVRWLWPMWQSVTSWWPIRNLKILLDVVGCFVVNRSRLWLPYGAFVCAGAYMMHCSGMSVEDLYIWLRWNTTILLVLLLATPLAITMPSPEGSIVNSMNRTHNDELRIMAFLCLFFLVSLLLSSILALACGSLCPWLIWVLKTVISFAVLSVIYHLSVNARDLAWGCYMPSHSPFDVLPKVNEGQSNTSTVTSEDSSTVFSDSP